MRTALERSLDEPDVEVFEDDGDRQHDDAVWRVDAGQECPCCRCQDVVIENRRKPVLYRCSLCQAGWYDWVTREAA